jgi:hypothetical protein
MNRITAAYVRTLLVLGTLLSLAVLAGATDAFPIT